jgi:hypothetical protein
MNSVTALQRPSGIDKSGSGITLKQSMGKRAASTEEIVPLEFIERKIVVLRGHRVMLDRDLADLYGVEPKRLNEQVKHNQDRFPEDFMFRLTLHEAIAIMLSRSQIATLKPGANVKYRPYVFTEHGAVMLANVLRSPIAVRASIQVVRAFVNLRQMLATNEELIRKVEAVERRVGKHDAELQEVLRTLRKLLERPPERPKRPIGFMPPENKR